MLTFNLIQLIQNSSHGNAWSLSTNSGQESWTWTKFTGFLNFNWSDVMIQGSGANSKLTVNERLPPIHRHAVPSICAKNIWDGCSSVSEPLNWSWSPNWSLRNNAVKVFLWTSVSEIRLVIITMRVTEWRECKFLKTYKYSIWIWLSPHFVVQNSPPHKSCGFC